MADVLADGLVFFNTVREEQLSQTVQYTRTGFTPFQVLATVGSTQQDVMDEAGFRTTARTIDFIISAASLVVSGVKTNPSIGDRIQLVVNGVVKVFEVLDAAGDGHFRWADSYGLMYRIHTKLVSET